jgi:hypothetical protein
MGDQHFMVGVFWSVRSEKWPEDNYEVEFFALPIANSASLW